MSQSIYKLFHDRTAENIRVEVGRLRDGLLFGSKKKVDKFGKVDIPQSAFLNALKMNSE